MYLDRKTYFQPGQLRHVVTIESPPTGEDATGANYGAWTTFAANVRAEIRPTGGSEQYGGGAYNPEAWHTVTMRHVAGFTSAMRINFGGRLFDVLNINDVMERGRWMVLTCKEGVSHGN